MDLNQKRARRDPKITKMAGKSVFLVDHIRAQIVDGKKRHEKGVEPSHGGRPGTMCTVGGRVREGNPPNFGLTWAL